MALAELFYCSVSEVEESVQEKLAWEERLRQEGQLTALLQQQREVLCAQLMQRFNTALDKTARFTGLDVPADVDEDQSDGARIAALPGLDAERLVHALRDLPNWLDDIRIAEDRGRSVLWLGKHFSRWWPYTERSLALLAGKLVIITAGALLCKFAPLEAPANQWMAVFAGLLLFVPLAVKLPSALAKDAAPRSKDLVDSSGKLGTIEAAALLLAPQLEGVGSKASARWPRPSWT